MNGFCNDITIGPTGSVYATDSWYPRVLRLVNGGAGAAALTNWLVSSVFPQDQWHLNGIDIEPSSDALYVVENHPGHLYRVPINGQRLGGYGRGGDDAAAAVRSRRPQGAEPDHAGARRKAAAGSRHRPRRGTATTGRVNTISTGFDGVATFAMWGGNAWLVENQGDHFWNPSGPKGPTATKPFRLVETPLMP